MKLLVSLCIGAALCTTSGCSGKKEQTSAEPPSAHAASEPAKPMKPPTAEQLPVAEDFEEEAQSEISRDNYEATLDTLDKEISADE